MADACGHRPDARPARYFMLFCHSERVGRAPLKRRLSEPPTDNRYFLLAGSALAFNCASSLSSPTPFLLSYAAPRYPPGSNAPMGLGLAPVASQCSKNSP